MQFARTGIRWQSLSRARVCTAANVAKLCQGRPRAVAVPSTSNATRTVVRRWCSNLSEPANVYISMVKRYNYHDDWVLHAIKLATERGEIEKLLELARDIRERRGEYSPVVEIMLIRATFSYCMTREGGSTESKEALSTDAEEATKTAAPASATKSQRVRERAEAYLQEMGILAAAKLPRARRKAAAAPSQDQEGAPPPTTSSNLTGQSTRVCWRMSIECARVGDINGSRQWWAEMLRQKPPTAFLSSQTTYLSLLQYYLRAGKSGAKAVQEISRSMRAHKVPVNGKTYVTLATAILEAPSTTTITATSAPSLSTSSSSPRANAKRAAWHHIMRASKLGISATDVTTMERLVILLCELQRPLTALQWLRRLTRAWSDSQGFLTRVDPRGPLGTPNDHARREGRLWARVLYSLNAYYLVSNNRSKRNNNNKRHGADPSLSLRRPPSMPLVVFANVLYLIRKRWPLRLTKEPAVYLALIATCPSLKLSLQIFGRTVRKLGGQSAWSIESEGESEDTNANANTNAAAKTAADNHLKLQLWVAIIDRCVCARRYDIAMFLCEEMYFSQALRPTPQQLWHVLLQCKGQPRATAWFLPWARLLVATEDQLLAHDIPLHHIVDTLLTSLENPIFAARIVRYFQQQRKVVGDAARYTILPAWFPILDERLKSYFGALDAQYLHLAAAFPRPLPERLRRRRAANYKGRAAAAASQVSPPRRRLPSSNVSGSREFFNVEPPGAATAARRLRNWWRQDFAERVVLLHSRVASNVQTYIAKSMLTFASASTSTTTGSDTASDESPANLTDTLTGLRRSLPGGQKLTSEDLWRYRRAVTLNSLSRAVTYWRGVPLLLNQTNTNATATSAPAAAPSPLSVERQQQPSGGRGLWRVEYVMAGEVKASGVGGDLISARNRLYSTAAVRESPSLLPTSPRDADV